MPLSNGELEGKTEGEGPQTGAAIHTRDTQALHWLIP